MKPNFALSLSFDGVELLQRATGGWLSVGSVRFDRPDLDRAVEGLRAQALRLAPDGITTKLIVPESEIRYAAVLAPGPTDEARRYQIEAEIEGLTPYPLAELAYDWSVEGDHVLVAIVARATLLEAEEFAAERGFNPMSFVGLPSQGQFQGEPFFGQTGAAAGLLPRGAEVQPDAEPVRVIGEAPAAPPPAAKARPPAPKTPAPAPKVPASSAPPAPVAPTDEPADGGEGFARVGNLVRKMGTRLRREQAAAAAPIAAPVMTPVAVPVATPAAAVSPEAESPALAAEARRPQPAPPVPAEAVPAEAAPAEAEPDEAPAAAVVAFSSRRAASAGAGAARPSAPPPRAPEAEKPGGRLAILPKPDAARDLGKRLNRKGRRAARDMLDRLGLLATARRVLGRTPPPAKPAKPARTAPARVAVVPAEAAARPVALDKASEAEALTLFGRRGQPERDGWLSARVVMAAGAALLLLLAVAVWGFYFTRPAPVAPLPSGIAQDDPVQVQPESVAIAAPDPVPTAVPAPETVAETAPEPVPAEPEAPPAETAAAPEPEAPVETASAPEAPAETVPDPEAMLETLVQQGLDEALPADVLDSLGTAELAAPEAGAEPAAEPAEAPVASAGAEPQPAPAAIRLTLPGRLEVPPVEEVAPASLPPPPPYEQVLAGIAPPAETTPEPQPEAAPEPEVQIEVTEGRPSVVPTPRPAGLAPEPPAPEPPGPEPEAVPEPEAAAEAAPESEAAPEPDVVMDDTPRADPALAGARPEPRSARVRALGEALRAAQPAPEPAEAEPAGRLDQGSLVPVAPPLTATAAAEAEAPPPGGVDLALLRPLRRPTDLVPDATAAAEPAQDETAPEAVARSLMPSARPQQLAARVEAALARQQPAPAAPAAAPAPTRTAAAAPNIPSSASVQQSATQTRAIRPREANLIGVFGAPSNRRALVRMPDGRVVRLQVGDRFDGGQVSAIGESELRYIRSGRDRVMRIASRG